jgi:outer membrane scaffolding protein for murein synthesis (MipA/OmpV family)
MNINKNYFLLLIILFSQKFFAAEGPPLKLALGVGEAVKTNNRFDNEYSGMDKSYLFTTLPFVNISYGPIQVGAQGLTMSFAGDREIAGYVNINRFGERYYGHLMDKRKESLYAGLGLKYHAYNIILAKDMSGRSKGVRAHISYGLMKIFENMDMLRLGIALEFVNSTASQYYYGVKNNEVTPTRALYSPSGYVVPGLNAFYMHHLENKISLNFASGVKKYPSVITKSPTTNGHDFEFSFLFGPTWNFY